MNEAAVQKRKGLVAGLIAYGIWGFLPVYIKALAGVHVFELLAHRALWSLLLMALLIFAMRRTSQLWAALRNKRTMALLLLSSLLIGANWLIYAWAVMQGRVLETSLGYFINPLISVGLAVLVLRERLPPLQWVAIALAAIGVGMKTWLGGDWPWLALALALSFVFYGLVRKQLAIDPLVGLMIETLFMAPFALIWLWTSSAPLWGHALPVDILLAMAGVVTAVPLVSFAYAARRLPLATMGLLQYVAPSMVFGLAVFAYGEPVNSATLAAFLLIWVGLALFAFDGLRLSRAGRSG